MRSISVPVPRPPHRNEAVAAGYSSSYSDRHREYWSPGVAKGNCTIWVGPRDLLRPLLPARRADTLRRSKLSMSSVEAERSRGGGLHPGPVSMGTGSNRRGGCRLLAPVGQASCSLLSSSAPLLRHRNVSCFRRCVRRLREPLASGTEFSVMFRECLVVSPQQCRRWGPSSSRTAHRPVHCPAKRSSLSLSSTLLRFEAECVGVVAGDLLVSDALCALSRMSSRGGRSIPSGSVRRAQVS